MELHADRPESSPDEPRPGPQPSEDEIARQMIERIAWQVDLESGTKPITSDAEPAASQQSPVDDPAETPADAVADAPADSRSERSEEDVARELIERIARDVDEGKRG